MKKRVLIINTIGLYFEGITSVIYNYINSMDKSDMDIDFIAFDSIEHEIKEKFERLGKVIIVPDRKKTIKKYTRALNRVLKSGYDVVHIHGNSGTMAIDALVAKANKVFNVIVHCHNTTCDHPLINKMLTPIMKFCSDNYIGCSNASGAWLYGKSKYYVLNNAITIEKFKFSDDKRQACRREFGLKDEFVIGHVGHFSEQKNHTFLVDVFKEINNIMPNSKLLLVSDGPRFQEIKAKVNSIGLDRSVIFTRARNDVDKLYQIMDLFILPSLWEGLPLVMLEAQAAALPMIVSTNITKDAKCSQRVEYKSIDDGAVDWAKQVVKMSQLNFNRNDDMSMLLQSYGFDIMKESSKLRAIYLSR